MNIEEKMDKEHQYGLYISDIFKAIAGISKLPNDIVSLADLVEIEVKIENLIKKVANDTTT